MPKASDEVPTEYAKICGMFLPFLLFFSHIFPAVHRWKDMKMRIIIAIGIAILLVIIIVPIVKAVQNK
jgi:uncharacterized membrane protein